ncbi:THAP domain-containing protein 1 B isoform X4 [Anabrus simplex]|uniref:THAP domain-containing protein 1 B isoform X4 n=1 Tax=Anabrus simplex TaxID=316456 RepID=UPI0035A33606
MVCCAIAGCTNHSRHAKERNLHFHSFPKATDLKQRWIHACKRRDSFSTINARVCSEHFGDDDYQRDLKSELLQLIPRKKLKSNAVPHKKLPCAKGPNGTSRMVERVTVTCEPPDYSQESLRVGQESKDEEALPQVCIKEEVVVKEEVQDPLEYLEQFSEEQASWSENNLSSREDLMEGDSRAVCEAIPQVWVKEEIEVKEEVQDPLDYVEETSEDQRSCS